MSVTSLRSRCAVFFLDLGLIVSLLLVAAIVFGILELTNVR
jgi:hypothetical protein